MRQELQDCRTDVGSRDKNNDDLKAEREDLELTRAAINEAREEIEALKLKLLEQEKQLGPGPNMIGKIRGIGVTGTGVPGMGLRAAREQTQNRNCTSCFMPQNCTDR